MADKYNSKIAGIFGIVNKAPAGYAVTISADTTLFSCAESDVDARWHRHEDCHKAQIRREGWTRFMWNYMTESIKNGYMNNKYEIQARQAETII